MHGVSTVLKLVWFSMLYWFTISTVALNDPWCVKSSFRDVLTQLRSVDSNRFSFHLSSTECIHTVENQKNKHRLKNVHMKCHDHLLVSRFGLLDVRTPTTNTGFFPLWMTFIVFLVLYCLSTTKNHPLGSRFSLENRLFTTIIPSYCLPNARCAE